RRERRVHVKHLETLARVPEGVQSLRRVEHDVVDGAGAGSLFEHVLETRSGLRVARGEEGHLVPGIGEAVGEQSHDPLDAAVALRGDGEPRGAELRDPHGGRCYPPSAGRRLSRYTSGTGRGAAW